MRGLYLLIDFCAVIVPFLFSFHPKLRFDKKWRYFFPANFLVAVIFIIWDELFTRAGVWHFNERYITGIYLFHLPIEEVLFFICIPYSCVFTYYCLQNYLPVWSRKTETIFALLLSTFLVATALVFNEKLYTFISFLSTGLLCVLFLFVFRVDWLGKAIRTYVVLLLPFLIVNGLLTGTGLAEPVVIYNNAENLGLRILTIPVEDIFYGFELFLLNLYFYELFNKLRQGRKLQTAI